MLLTSLKTKVANWVVVCTLATAFLAAVVGLLAHPASGANCARVGGVPSGDWTVSTTQVCNNIVIVMDGDLLIASGGDLTIRNGELKFVQDASHIYGISVAAGFPRGVLRLENSRVWTDLNLIDPYIKLNVAISGDLVMTNSTLAFPGTLASAPGATVTLTNSTITRSALPVESLLPPGDVDANDDAPVMSFVTSTVHLFRSRIEQLYENVSAVGPDSRSMINLEATTQFTAVDSFLGVDFNPDDRKHNIINLTGNSNAYLYGVTFDSSQNPDLPSPWVNAISTEAGSRADVYRWADVQVVDFNNRVVAGAVMTAFFAGPESGCATFRDGAGCVPPGAINAYLGGSWDRTNASGMARLPLLSDWIDSTTFPNSRFVGAFNLVATASARTGESTLTFDAYPLMGATHVSEPAAIQIVTLIQPFPELSISSIAFSGGNGPNIDAQPLNRQLTITATVNNTGTVDTVGVLVYFYSVDVDTDRDGFLDSPHPVYLAAGSFIGSSNPISVSGGGFALFPVPWTPLGNAEVSRIVSAVVDPSTGTDPQSGGAISELNETNNLNSRTVTTFTWPDLHLDTDPVVRIDPPIPIVNNAIQLVISVRNEGTAAATAATFGVYRATPPFLSEGPEVTLSVPVGQAMEIALIWQPTAAGNQTIRIRATAAGSAGADPAQYRNFDFDAADAPSDNYADKVYDVRTEPALSLTILPPTPSPFRGERFNLTVNITNSGETEAFNIVVAVFDVTIVPEVELGAITLNVPTGSSTRTILTQEGLPASGDRTIEVRVDARDTVTETNENDNNDTVIVFVQAPTGSIRPDRPTSGQRFAPGVTMTISCRVLDTADRPISGVIVTARLRNSGGTEIVNASGTSRTADGLVSIFLTIPQTQAEGPYTLYLDALDATIADLPIPIVIGTPVGFWSVPFLGLPVWIWLLVVIGAIAAIAGGTAYVKFVGLGKLVECGECGAFIAEESAACPKCGVEFEKDMAKCSNCQAWIPSAVKQCPECGVQFATGEIEMADYEDKMKGQYEEVKRRYREAASQELGRSLTDREFEDWWRTQPTYVTFEDWLREEEDMRRMGSKPCPVCSTLNSVTGKVCHKCGTLLTDEGRPGATVKASRPVPAQPTSEEAPSDAIPKKVVKKSIAGAPVVQKKVVRRPAEEGEEGDEGSQI